VKFDIPANAGPQALREAASAGDAKALFEVASRFAEGRGTKADMEQAAKWYEASADLGSLGATVRSLRAHQRRPHVQGDPQMF